MSCRWVIVVAIALLPMAAMAGVKIDAGGAFTLDGKPFVPRGFNFIRLHDGRSHDTFDPEFYDAAAAQKALERMHSDGFNVVRVFINADANLPGAIAVKGQGGLRRAYVGNLADFLSRAQRQGVKTIICTELFPAVHPYIDGLRPAGAEISPANAHYLDKTHIVAKAAYLRDLIVGLKSIDAGYLDDVFCYDLHNELCYAVEPPFTLDHGSVTMDGRKYALPEQAAQLADDGAIAFINTLADAIHAVHPAGLIDASVFTFAAVGRQGPGDFKPARAAWKNRIPFRPLAIARSKAQIVDIHFYAANMPAWEKDLACIEFDATRKLAKESGKPMLVGEFGAHRKAYSSLPDAAAWIGKLAAEFKPRGFSGWLYWTYDTFEQNDQIWHAREGDGVICNKLRDIP